MLTSLNRDEFLAEYWDYNPGEHALWVTPTGGGKTHLAYQCLQESMRQHPGLSVLSLMPKPADPATADWANRLNLRETPDWPPRKRVWDLFDSSTPDGYVLWPPHPLNLPPDKRREAVGKVLRKGLDAQYKRGNSITFVDDAHSAAVLMGLNEYLEELLVNGRSGGSGAFLALQKPSGTLNTGSVSSFAYSSATHIFLGRDNDERNIRRFGEIGGVDPRLVEQQVRNLRTFNVDGHSITEWLYIDLRGPYMALIGP